MFVLYKMIRDVRIDPPNLGHDRVEAIREELNRRFGNKVLPEIGLGIALWDIISISEGSINPSDGGVHCIVVFRYVIMRPFQDEIIIGKIKNCTMDGVHVTLGFFDDILIPPEALQFPSRFDEQEQIWIWEYQQEDEDEPHEMYMDKGESIKFRITSEQFADSTPYPPGPVSAAAPSNKLPANTQQPSTSTFPKTSTSEEEEIPYKIPLTITGTINEPGLGLLSWWS